jgi:hypothetical protein
MKRFARALAVLFGIVVLGSFVLLVPQKSATAQGGPAVTIVSPLPLPVRGNVSATVSGPVAAQQSGNWNVGIAGTPNVSVTNTPMVSLAAGSSMKVSNPLDNQSNPTPLAYWMPFNHMRTVAVAASLPLRLLVVCSRRFPLGRRSPSLLASDRIKRNLCNELVNTVCRLP